MGVEEDSGGDGATCFVNPDVIDDQLDATTKTEVKTGPIDDVDPGCNWFEFEFFAFVGFFVDESEKEAGFSDDLPTGVFHVIGRFVVACFHGNSAVKLGDFRLGREEGVKEALHPVKDGVAGIDTDKVAGGNAVDAANLDKVERLVLGVELVLG